jgi:hypothetical protein
MPGTNRVHRISPDLRSSEPLGGALVRNMQAEFPRLSLTRISHTRSTAACSFPSWRCCACSLLGQYVPIQPVVTRGARLATPGNSRASSRKV